MTPDEAKKHINSLYGKPMDSPLSAAIWADVINETCLDGIGDELLIQVARTMLNVHNVGDYNNRYGQ